MVNQLELAVEERAVLGKTVKRLRKKGIVPANLYGRNLPSIPLQMSSVTLRGLLARGGKNGILSLKVGNKPAVQALIKQLQHDPVSRETMHVDFYQVAATETLKTHVQLRFINEVAAANLFGGTILRSLNQVMVECLPVDLPTHISVDLSAMKEVGAAIRVGDLKVSPAVTILNDCNDMVVGVHQQARMEKTEEDEGKTKSVAAAI